MDRRRVVNVGLGVVGLGVGLFGAYTLGRPKTVEAGLELVALTTIYPGEPLAGRVAVFTLPQAYIPTGALGSAAAVAGKTATATLYRGDPVLVGDVGKTTVQSRLGIPKGLEGVVLSIPSSQLAGTTSGEVVNLVATGGSSQGGIGPGQLVVADAPIVGFFSGTGTPMTSFAGAGGTATNVELAVTKREASELAKVGTSFNFVLDPWYVGVPSRKATGTSAAGGNSTVNSTSTSAAQSGPSSKAAGTSGVVLGAHSTSASGKAGHPAR